MAAIAGNQARIFLDSVDLSCVTSSLTVETTTGEYDATTLCSTVMEYRPGLNQGTISIEGFFDGVGTGGEEAALVAALGASTKNVTAIFGYQDLPAPAYIIEGASNMGMNWSVPTDGLVTMNGSFKGREGVKRAKLSYHQASRSATGLLSAIQIPGTLTTSTGRAVLYFHGYTGSLSGPLTATVQSSASGAGSWVTEGSFSLAAPGSQGVAITTPVGEYFALNITSLGGATTVSVSLVIVIDGIT
jgi:hypothetical protein